MVSPYLNWQMFILYNYKLWLIKKSGPFYFMIFKSQIDTQQYLDIKNSLRSS